MLPGAEAWPPSRLLSPVLPSNLMLWSTENSLLTVPLGPGEASNTDVLDKLRQAVGEGHGGGGGGRGSYCCVGFSLHSDLTLLPPEGDGAV